MGNNAKSANETGKGFLMPIKNVVSKAGQPVIAFGTVERGIIRVGEAVDIIGFSEKSRQAVVVETVMYRKLADKAVEGDYVGIALRGLLGSDVEEGQVLATPGTVHAYTSFRGLIHVLTPEEGGKKKPFFNGLKSQFTIRSANVSGTIALINGRNNCDPGQECEMEIQLNQPVPLETGLPFNVCLDGVSIGTGVVISVQDYIEESSSMVSEDKILIGTGAVTDTLDYNTESTLLDNDSAPCDILMKKEKYIFESKTEETIVLYDDLGDTPVIGMQRGIVRNVEKDCVYTVFNYANGEVSVTKEKDYNGQKYQHAITGTEYEEIKGFLIKEGYHPVVRSRRSYIQVCNVWIGDGDKTFLAKIDESLLIHDQECKTYDQKIMDDSFLFLSEPNEMEVGYHIKNRTKDDSLGEIPRLYYRPESSDKYQRNKPCLTIGCIGQSGCGKTSLMLAILTTMRSYYGFDFDDEARGEYVKIKNNTVARNKNCLEYETPNRKYVHIDCSNEEMKTSIFQMDCVILVIDAEKYDAQQVSEQILLVSCLEKQAVVFINKCDGMSDDNRLAEIENEVCNAIKKYRRYNSTDNRISIIRGSALQAIKDPYGENAIRIVELMEAVDWDIHCPANDLDNPFLLVIDDAFSVAGRGIAAIGKVMQGVLNKGENVEIDIGGGMTKTAKVVGLFIFGKATDQLQCGDYAVVLLRGVQKEDVTRGKIIAKKSRSLTRTVTVSLLGYGKEDFLKSAFITGSEWMFYFAEGESLGKIRVLDLHRIGGIDRMITIELDKRLPLNTESRFIICRDEEIMGGGCVLRT